MPTHTFSYPLSPSIGLIQVSDPRQTDGIEMFQDSEGTPGLALEQMTVNLINYQESRAMEGMAFSLSNS